ncbi:MAG TPA: hypothetical protein VMY37_20085 [Thermoguttaceae bacterium]|nr:hypothetical protein [Thermoguttaceae bacterium]
MNKSGMEHVELRTDPFPYVRVTDAAGDLRVAIQPSENGPITLFFNHEGIAVGGVTFTPDGRLQVMLTDEAGAPRASIFLGDDGEPIVASVDGEGPDVHITNIRPACDPPPSVDRFPSYN